MDLESVRTKIDEIDTGMLTLFAQRAEQSKLIRQFKKPGDVTDALREEDLKRKWVARARTLNVEPVFALRLLDLVLTESKRIQQSS